jgi:hypothetical protein
MRAERSPVVREPPADPFPDTPPAISQVASLIRSQSERRSHMEEFQGGRIDPVSPHCSITYGAEIDL